MSLHPAQPLHGSWQAESRHASLHPVGQMVSRFSLQRPRWLLLSLLLGLSLETPLRAVEDSMLSASEHTTGQPATADSVLQGETPATAPTTAPGGEAPVPSATAPTAAQENAYTRARAPEAGLRPEPSFRQSGAPTAGTRTRPGLHQGRCGTKAGKDGSHRKTGQVRGATAAGAGKAKSTTGPKKSRPTGLVPLGPSRRYTVDACQSGWMVLVGESLQQPEIIRLPARLLPEPCREGALVQLRVFKGWTTQALSLTGQHSRLQVFGIQPPPGPDGQTWKGGKAPRPLASQTLVWCRSGQKPVLLSHRLFQTLPRPGTRLTLLAELVHEGTPVSALAALRSTLEVSCPTTGPMTGNPAATGLCFWDLTGQPGAAGERDSVAEPTGASAEAPRLGSAGGSEQMIPAPAEPLIPLAKPSWIESTQPEPAKLEPVQLEPVRLEPARVEPSIMPLSAG